MAHTAGKGGAGSFLPSIVVLSASLFFSWIGIFAPLGVSAAPQVARQAQSPTPVTGDVYVTPTGNDAGDGSQKHPWATITHASQMIGPGATVHVSPGTYDEVVVTKTSGTASARIKYISDKRWGALIAPKKTSHIVWNNTGDYSDIIGFEIGSDDCNGIGIGGSYQRVFGNNAHNAAVNCADSNGGSGINSYNYSAGNNAIIANYVHDVGVGDPLCGHVGHRVVHGIYVANMSGVVQNNISVKNCDFGIHLWHAASHAIITNNTCAFNRAGGIVVGAGDAPCTEGGCPDGGDYNIVRNNIVVHNGNPVLKGWGITEEGITGPHNQYSNNLSYQNLSGDFHFRNHLSCSNCIVGKDPEFVAPSSTDFRLRRGSPAIGHGTSENAPTTDYAGRERTSADIGASAAISSP